MKSKNEGDERIDVLIVLLFREIRKGDQKKKFFVQFFFISQG